MKRLYRLEIRGWYPVMLEDDEWAPLWNTTQLSALYDECDLDPRLIDLGLLLVPASDAEVAQYGKGEAKAEAERTGQRPPSAGPLGAAETAD